jgi:glucose-6-phosphate 1-dehydrogenase
VIQNHLLQLLAFTAMEEPTSFSSHELRAEKIKILNATRLVGPLDETTAHGQYSGGWQGGELVRGLKEEEGFNPESRTETYAAITCEVATRRWAGVPFYLRHGKRLGRRVTEIAVIFKRAPHLPFDSTMTEELGQNAFVIRVQPDEGVTLRFGSKVPGSQMEVRDVNMDFGYGSSFTEASPEAYERLILDVLLGEPSLFPVNEEVERSWEILDPVLEHWQAMKTGPDPYPAGSWGPDSAKEMLARTGRVWRRP